MGEFTPPDIDPATRTTATELNTELLAALARGRTAPKVDWVSERAACMPRQVFERLLSGVQTDANQRSAQLDATQYQSRVVIVDSASLFSVAVTWFKGKEISVRFRLDGGTIVAEDERAKARITATPVLDVDGRCKLRVEGELLEEWQFRMRALNELFFPTSM